MSDQGGEPVWTQQRIVDWLDDHWLGVGSAEAIAAEIIEEYEAKLAQQAARISELERRYKDLLELNERNCSDALRIKQADEALFSLMLEAIADLKAKDERIAELESQRIKDDE